MHATNFITANTGIARDEHGEKRTKDVLLCVPQLDRRKLVVFWAYTATHRMHVGHRRGTGMQISWLLMRIILNADGATEQ